MHTICPAYEGSVNTSWYPVIAVLKTTSPSPTTSAPSGTPTNARPSSNTSAACVLARNDHRLVDSVLFLHQDLDALGVGRRHVLADVIGADRQLPMAAVDEHRELDRARPAKVHHRVHRGARCPAVVDHVIDQDHHLAVDLWHLAHRLATIGRPKVKVVAMQRHVETAERDVALFHPRQDGGQALGQDVAFAHDADDHDVIDTSVALDDLVRDAMQRPADLVGVHHRCLQAAFGDAHDSNLSRSAIRICRPFRACRKYAARGSASTSGAISSTRGNGCMSTAYLRIRSSEPLSIR